MTLRLENLTIDCADPHRLAAFWAAALGYEVETGEEEAETGEAEVWALAKDPTTGWFIYFQQVPETKGVKNRLHLDVRASGTRDEEVARLVDLGATVVEGFGGPAATWTVMRDPEGNEFCVLRGPNDPVPPGGQPVEA
jgi:hypothetical protein